MRDFTIKIYKKLLTNLLQAGYEFITFEQFCEGKRAEKFIILRHDADEMAGTALKFAEIEHSFGIKTTYFFRIVKQSNKPEVIKKIASLGHEIGYHYEDLAFADGNYEKAIYNFRKNLAYFRTFYPVRTVCMHGSSTSEYNNQDLWKVYNLENEQLIGEPYLSVDFNEIFYISDTGYCWDGFEVAVRDVVESNFNIAFHHTNEIIKALENNTFPSKAMFVVHTLWTDNLVKWYGIFLREILRNSIKKMSKKNILIKNIYKFMGKIYWKRD